MLICYVVFTLKRNTHWVHEYCNVEWIIIIIIIITTYLLT